MGLWSVVENKRIGVRMKKMREIKVRMRRIAKSENNRNGQNFIIIIIILLIITFIHNMNLVF